MHGASSDWGTVLVLHFILLGLLAFCACLGLLFHGLSLRAARWPPMWFAYGNLGFCVLLALFACWLSPHYMAWLRWTIRSGAAVLVTAVVVATYVRARCLRSLGAEEQRRMPASNKHGRE